MTTIPQCPSCKLPKKGIKKDKDGDPVRVCGNRRCTLFLKTSARCQHPATCARFFSVCPHRP